MLKPGTPRHEQISDWLREQIQGGIYTADTQIPSENQLTTHFAVSRITVRRALQTLENEGLIYRRQGLGSFVKDIRVRQGLVRLTDFVEDMAQAGLEASSRILHFDREKATGSMVQALAVPEDTLIFRLDRLRLGDGEPIAFDQTWLPAFYAGLLDGHDLEQTTIYRILEKQSGITVEGGRYRIKAVNADAEVAHHLAVPKGRALLLIERISFTLSETPIYYQRRYYRSDRVTYELALERRPGEQHPTALRDFEPVFKSNPRRRAAQR